MKKKLLALLIALTLLLLTACGSGGGDKFSTDSGIGSTADWNGVNTDTAPMEPSTPMEAPASLGESGWNENMEYDTPSSGGTTPANAKMILSGDLELETKEFDNAVQAVDALVKELGGWYESRSIHQGGSRRSIDAVVRIPANQFFAFMERAGEVAHKTYANDRQQDVSEAYYDSEARLSTQRTKLERLQTLLTQAENMEDIIALESAISETELQIEYLTGSLRKYDNLVDYATVNLNLREVYRLSTDQEIPQTFSQRLGDAFIIGLQRGIEGLEEFTISVARNWMSLLLLAAVIVGIVLLIRRHERKRRNRPFPPFPPAPPQPPKQEEDKKEQEKENKNDKE